MANNFMGGICRVKPWVMWSAALAGILISLTVRSFVDRANQAPPPQTHHADVATSNWDRRIAWATSLSQTVVVMPEAAEIERMSGLWGTLGQWLTPPQTELTDNPPLPLHTGHQASLLASGALNGVLGMGEDRHLVRGLVIKETKVEEEEEEDAHGNSVTVSREVESFRIKISAVTAAGKLVELT